MAEFAAAAAAAAAAPFRCFHDNEGAEYFVELKKQCREDAPAAAAAAGALCCNTGCGWGPQPAAAAAATVAAARLGTLCGASL